MVSMDVTKEKMIKHARENDLMIHPSIVEDWDEWLKETNNLGHCPCSPRRPECPCPESVREAQDGKRGACCCTVFVTDTYVERFAEKLGYTKEDFYTPD